MPFFVFLLIIISLGIFIAFIELVLRHQREMAIIKSKGSDRADDRMQALERKIADLTEIVHDQTLVIENLNALPRGSKDVEERLRA